MGKEQKAVEAPEPTIEKDWIERRVSALTAANEQNATKAKKLRDDATKLDAQIQANIGAIAVLSEQLTELG